MYINDRDQINYHGFIKALREMQGANLRQVAQGICSDSEVFRTEMGDRLPEKLMRDRITSRLGVSGEEYEEYLRPEEYRQWEIRMFILDSINKGDKEAAQKGIEEYDKIQDKNPVQEQFVDTMRYMYAKMSGASEDILRALIELAVVHTIPDIDSAFLGVHLLADQELNLIAEYTYAREYYGAKEDEFAWRLSEYLKILDYIDHSYMDTIGRSKVYPRTTSFICEWILNNKPKKKDLEMAFDLCTKSIELLRDASRLYYFVELVEYRREIIRRLLKHKMDEARKTELCAMYEKDGEWETLFKELYVEYDVPVYMPNFTYLYVETECNNVVEVIRTRRNMLKLSRVRVSDNICSEKTMERMENYTHSPSIVIVRDLFDRIGLCAEYKRARVITDNAEMLRIINEMVDYMNDWELDASIEYIQELEENLHMDISYNKQTVQRLRNIICLRNHELKEEELYKLALETLEYTIPFSAVIRKEDVYLTRAELTCIYDLAFRTQGEVSAFCFSIIEKNCTNAKNENINATNMCIYEMLMGELASYLGDNGDYKESLEFSEKLLKESLRHRRSVVLVNNMYNKIWNYKMKHELHNISYDNTTIINGIKKCISLAELDRKDTWVSFLQQKLHKM